MDLSKGLEDICQEEHVGATVEVVIVPRVVQSKALQTFCIVLVFDVLVRKRAVEGFIWE